MPYGDRTGPDGRGAMTGRGLGDCITGVPKDEKEKETNTANLGFFRRGFRNFGRRGGGRGRGGRW